MPKHQLAWIDTRTSLTKTELKSNSVSLFPSTYDMVAIGNTVTLNTVSVSLSQPLNAENTVCLLGAEGEGGGSYGKFCEHLEICAWND